MAEPTKKHVHPCAGLSRIAVETFEAIAVGQTPPYRQQTFKALIARGLIEQIGERRLGRDHFGDIKVPVYEVPLPVHYKWCSWCGENIDESDV